MEEGLEAGGGRFPFGLGPGLNLLLLFANIVPTHCPALGTFVAFELLKSTAALGHLPPVGSLIAAAINDVKKPNRCLREKNQIGVLLSSGI